MATHNLFIEGHGANHADVGAPTVPIGHGGGIALISEEETVRQHKAEICEMFEAIQDIRVDSILHDPKILRLGQLHINTARLLIAKAKAEAARTNGEAIAERRLGIKVISKTIGGLAANPLLFVK